VETRSVPAASFWLLRLHLMHMKLNKPMQVWFVLDALASHMHHRGRWCIMHEKDMDIMRKTMTYRDC
jgi:hypothetical protein